MVLRAWFRSTGFVYLCFGGSNGLLLALLPVDTANSSKEQRKYDFSQALALSLTCCGVHKHNAVEESAIFPSMLMKGTSHLEMARLLVHIFPSVLFHVKS